MNLAAFDLNLLRVLDALLSEGSTVRAGARIGLSQPAVSAALGRLRHALGDELFLRRGQGLEPTDFARALAPRLRAALEEVEAMLSAPSDFDPAAAKGRFVLIGDDSFAELLMPPLARRLAAAAPGLRVHMTALAASGNFEALDRREADIAFLPLQPVPDWVDRLELDASGLSLVARAGHPALAGLAPGAALPLDLYCALGHVFFARDASERGVADEALARLGRSRRVAMTLPAFSAVARAVAESELIALLPDPLAARWAASYGLTVYRPPVPIPPVRLMMIWRRAATAAPAHRWLRDVMVDLLAAYRWIADDAASGLQ